MYDTALPHDTLNALIEIGNVDLVVGIPSYRNGSTIQHVTATVAQALHTYYPQWTGVIVNADGLAYDETVRLAQDVPLPANVRQVATRYLGLPGKGSAIHAILEAAMMLQARALIIIEADTASVRSDWIPALVEPILRKEANFVLPDYGTVSPVSITNEIIAYPLLKGLYNLELRYPLAGEVAMAGGVAAYFADRDVWETDVARDGIDGWMVLQMIADGGQIAQVPLSPKQHREYESLTGAEVKFGQEVGMLLRTGLLHEKVWREGERNPLPLVSIGAPVDTGLLSLPTAEPYLSAGIEGIRYDIEKQWMDIPQPRTLEVLRAILHHRTFQQFDAALWMYILYDFLVVYNLGEGDPDKVLAALYPLYLLRYGAMITEANGSPERWESLIEAQGKTFREGIPYLGRRWDGYVPPEL
jgi:hypothetical protein